MEQAELKAAAEVVNSLMEIPNIKHATKYLDAKRTIRGTLIGKPRKGAPRVTLAISIGKPNYKERFFIKDCLKAGEPFPVKKVQLKMQPVRRTKAK